MYSTYDSFKNTCAATLDAQIKAVNFYAKARKYTSSLEYSLSDNEIPVQVYHNLISAVHDNMHYMYDYVAGISIEALVFAVIADLSDHLSCYGLVVYVKIARCFSEDHEKARLCSALACDMSLRILRENGVQDRIGHLVADLVRMSLCN